MRRFPARAASLAAVLAIASLGLAGCLDSGFPGGPTSSSPPQGIATGEPTPGGTASASPTPSATPTPEGPTPVAMSCDALIPLQPLYDLNPNYALVPTSSAASGSLAAAALDDRGTACKVVHTSSGATAVITVSQPDPSALAADRTAAGSSTGTAVDPSSGTSTAVYGSGSSLQAFSSTRRFTGEADSAFDPDDLAALLAIAVHAAG